MLSEEIDVFIEQKKKTRAVSTVRSLRQTMKQFIDFLGDKPPNEIVTGEVGAFFDHLGNTDQPATVKTKRKNLSTFFNWLLKQRKIEFNPVVATDPILVEGRSREAFTKVEYDKLFASCETDDDRLFLQWLFSGIRPPQEYVEIDESKIDLENKVMEVYRKKMKTYGQIEILPGLYEELVKAKEEGRTLKPFATDWKSRHRFQNLCERAELPKNKCIMYNCRHTIATMLSNSPGWDVMRIKRQMGWTDINQANRYVDEAKFSSWKFLRDQHVEDVRTNFSPVGIEGLELLQQINSTLLDIREIVGNLTQIMANMQRI